MSEKFTLLEQETLADGFLPMQKLRLTHRRYDGSWSEEIERECYTPRHEAAGVVLYDPNQQQLALVEQIRMGAIIKDDEPWVIEPVMGMIDKEQESPESVAKREAIEEAGAQVQRLIPITKYYVSPGINSEYVHLYCGIVDIDSFSGVFGLDEEHEDIKVIKFSIVEAKQKLADGSFNNAATIIAVQWLLLNLDNLNAC